MSVPLSAQLAALSVGDRIAYRNFGFYSFGMIVGKRSDGRYRIEWDDGYLEAFGWSEDEGWYAADELQPEANVNV